jgi:SAM-dependent methyltransferase
MRPALASHAGRAYLVGMANAALGTRTLESFSQARRYNRWLYSRIAPFLSGGTALEVGCGIGNITRLLCERFRVTAIDIDPAYTENLAATLGPAGVRTACLDLSVEARYDREFDNAVCLNVLEHIPDEQAALRAMYRALVPGGRLAILVPAFHWLYGSVDRAIDHQRRYTRRSLRRSLAEAGFQVKRTFYFNVFGIPGWFWTNRVRKRDTLPEGQLALFDRLVPLFRIADLPFRPVLGISVVAWAVRPADPA